MRFRSRFAGLVLIAAGTTLSLPALAIPGGDEGLYIAAGGNWTSVDKKEIDDSDTTVSFRIGYMFNSFFGVEGGLLPLGDYKKRDTRLEIDAFTAAGVLNIPIAIVDLYGKLGLALVDAEFSSPLFRESSDSVEPFIALGIELDLGVLNFYLEASRIDTDGDADVDVVGVGIKLEF